MKISENLAALEKAFTKHPKETGETYLQHFWFTVKMAVRLTCVGFVLLVHGIFPFFFMKRASKQIEKIYLIMKSRIPKARREQIEADFEI